MILMEEVIHGRSEDGREQHFMTKVNGHWECECGAVKDRYGNDMASDLRIAR